MSSSGETVTRSRDAISPTVVELGSRPSATTRTTMSRSVTIPVSRPCSTIGTGPTSSFAMTLAASMTVVSGSQVFTWEVMTSLMLVPMRSPFRFLASIDEGERAEAGFFLALASSAEKQPHGRAHTSGDHETGAQRARGHDRQVPPELRADIGGLPETLAEVF